MLAGYAHIGLFLAVAIFFAVTTVLLPLFLSLAYRLRERSDVLKLIPAPAAAKRFIPLPSFVMRLMGLSRFVPWNPNPIKESTYECGMETIGKAWVQFNFRYYFYALIFIALDILVIFLYPWATELKNLGLFAFIAILVFVFIIMVGYVYAWRKRVLEWK